jgi:hypothetical protein
VYNKDDQTTLPKLLGDVAMDDIEVLVSRQQVCVLCVSLFIHMFSSVPDHAEPCGCFPTDGSEAALHEVQPRCQIERPCQSVVEIRLQCGGRRIHPSLFMAEHQSAQVQAHHNEANFLFKFLSLCRQRFREYKDLYKEFLHDPEKQSIKNKLTSKENNIDLFNVVVAREQAKHEVSFPSAIYFCFH